MRQIGREPIFIDRGEGAELLDVDGQRYIDYVCSWGPMVLGHADPDVIEAVQSAAARGTSFGAPTELEVLLAEEIVKRVPSSESVRMTSSGTEAAMSAIRLARASTGREKILKFSGAYHGHSDSLLADAGSGVATLGVPGSPGVTEGATRDTVIIPWNNAEALNRACAEHEFAALIAEPYPANMGLVLPHDGFLRLLQDKIHENGGLLIFDEVISGFRVAPGGVQELSGVVPDLTVLGKIVGGGLPAAAYTGRRTLMEQISPAGPVYQAGTLSGNPLAMAAGITTLKKLDEAAYKELAATTAQLADGLRAAAAEYDFAVEVVQATGLLTVFFTDAVPHNYEDAKDCNTELHAAWCRALLERGVYPPASQFEAWFPSLAHTPDLIDATLTAAAAAFAAIAGDAAAR